MEQTVIGSCWYLKNLPLKKFAGFFVFAHDQNYFVLFSNIFKSFLIAAINTCLNCEALNDIKI
jgi:hypothetical protein